jgi:hypothetical protein
MDIKEKPDKDIEEFWIGLKNSIYNFYKSVNIPTLRPVGSWSDNLNLLQSINEYDEIQKCIRQYISLFAIDIIRFSGKNKRHFKILLTNIKRWNKLSKQYSFNNSSTEEYYNIMYLIIDLYKSIIDVDDNSNIKYIFQQIELLLINKDFSTIIKYAIENNKPGILTKLTGYNIDVKEEIKKLYNIDIPAKISFKKLITNILDTNRYSI